MSVLASSLAACSAGGLQPQRPPAANAAAATLPAATLPAPGTYSIDAEHSEVRVLVYRTGALAGLGHNHVLVNRGVSGSLTLTASLADSSLSLSVPADAFVVDENQARREEGSEFAGAVPEDAKSGTRRNLLSAAVLNGAQFPAINVTAMGFSGTPAAMQAVLRLNVAGHESIVPATCVLSGDAGRLLATGTMQLRQTALGLAPLSLLHGALAVQDLIEVKFRLAVASG